MCKVFPTRRKGNLWDRSPFGNGGSSQSQNGLPESLRALCQESCSWRVAQAHRVDNA